MTVTAGDIKKQLRAALDAIKDAPDHLPVNLAFGEGSTNEPYLVSEFEIKAQVDTYENSDRMRVTELALDITFTMVDDE